MSTNAAIQGWQLWYRPWEKTAIYYPPYESATWKKLHNKKSTSFELLSLFSNSTASRNFNMGILRISCFTVWKHTASRGWKLREAVSSQDFPASTFGPIWEIGDDFSLPAASLLVNPMPGVTFYSPSPNLPAFSACRLNSLRFSQMGAFYVHPTTHG